MRRRTCDLLGLSTLGAQGLSGYSNGPFLAIGGWTPQGWAIISLDGQVLMIALFAVALILLIWSMEEGVVRMDVELDRKDVLHVDRSGLRLRAGSRPEGAEGIVPTALRPRLDR